MVSEAQKRANEKYRRKNVKAISVRFYPADHGLYEYAQRQKEGEGVNAYIKRLIREDMERNN